MSIIFDNLPTKIIKSTSLNTAVIIVIAGIGVCGLSDHNGSAELHCYHDGVLVDQEKLLHLT